MGKRNLVGILEKNLPIIQLLGLTYFSLLFFFWLLGGYIQPGKPVVYILNQKKNSPPGRLGVLWVGGCRPFRSTILVGGEGVRGINNPLFNYWVVDHPPYLQHSTVDHQPNWTKNLDEQSWTKKVSRWWFQRFFYFHLYLGKWCNLTNIFQMGWNHHLDNSSAQGVKWWPLFLLCVDFFFGKRLPGMWWSGGISKGDDLFFFVIRG